MLILSEQDDLILKFFKQFFFLCPLFPYKQHFLGSSNYGHALMPASEHESSGEGRQWRLVLREKRETRVRYNQGGNSSSLARANMERRTNEGPFWLPAKSKIVENSITTQTYDVKCEIKIGSR